MGDGYMYAMIVSTNYHDLLDVLSVSTLINHHVPMQMYDRHHTTRKNWFHLARTSCLGHGPKPMITFESMEAILSANLAEELFEPVLCEGSTVHSLVNVHWTDAAREGGGLDINNPVFGHYCVGNL